MLTLLLKILGIAGIILLAVLGLLLLIVLLVLFVPVFYKAKVDKDENLSVSVRADWLLGFLRVRFFYPEPGSVTAKVLFFKVYDSKAEPKEADKTSGSETPESVKEDPKTQKETAGTKTPDAPRPQTPPPHTADSSDEAGSQETVRQNPIQKIQYTFRNICDKIKIIRENIAYYKEVLLCEDTKGLLNHAFMRLGRILKSIRPRKLKADVRFGTGSPDTTGYVYAIYGVLCPYLGKHVFLTPDFEQSVLEGNLYAAGHITIFRLLWHGLMIALDKRLRQLISKLKQEDLRDGK